MSTPTPAFATSKFRKRSHVTSATAIAAFMPKSLKAARSRRATTSKSHEAQIAPLSVQVFVLKDAALLSRRPSMKTYRIAAIPGDGIGTEVVSAGIEVLHALARREGSFQFKVDHFDWGGEYYKKHGRMMPENGRSLIRNHDAILFGSAGHPDIPDHITLWGLLQPFDQYANVRPTRVLPGITSPLRSVKHKELDWVIVRENSEGEYAGVGGRVHEGSPLEAATDVAMFTRTGVARIMRFAFRLAQSRPRRLLTVVTKSNAQRHAMVMWDEIAAEVAREFPDVTSDKVLVDAMTMRMVT